jgi:hypothetical protein
VPALARYPLPAKLKPIPKRSQNTRNTHPALAPANQLSLTWQRRRCCVHGAVGLREGGEEDPGVFPPCQGCRLSPLPPPPSPPLKIQRFSKRQEILCSTRALGWPSRTFPMRSWPRPVPSTGAACEAPVTPHQHQGPQTQPRFVCRGEKPTSMTHPITCSSCWCADGAAAFSFQAFAYRDMFERCVSTLNRRFLNPKP